MKVCFVDDQDDAKLYKQNKDAVAQAIVKAVLSYNKSCRWKNSYRNPAGFRRWGKVRR